MSGPIRYDSTEAPARPVVNVGIGLTVAVVLTAIVCLVFVVAVLDRLRAADVQPGPMAMNEPRLPSGPRLHVTPGGDLRALREWETGILGSSAWVNRGTGVVRIPIDHAIGLLAQRGLPSRAAAPAPPSPVAPPAAPAPIAPAGEHH